MATYGSPDFNVESVCRLTPEIRAAVEKHLTKDSRGFKAGTGGGRQKEHFCTGAALLPPPPTKPGSPEHVRVEASEVRVCSSH